MALTITVLSTASCGVPLDDAPRAIDRSTTTQPEVDEGSSSSGKTVAAYFFRGKRLERLPVSVDTDSPTIADALSALLSKPTPPLESKIPSGTKVLGVRLSGDKAVIDLSETITDFEGNSQKGAYAQFVYTALASPRVDRVTFLVEGESVKAPTDRGGRANVRASDYDPPLNPG